jgi:hypothetical protein
MGGEIHENLRRRYNNIRLGIEGIIRFFKEEL